MNLILMTDFFLVFFVTVFGDINLISIELLGYGYETYFELAINIFVKEKYYCPYSSEHPLLCCYFFKFV